MDNIPRPLRDQLVVQQDPPKDRVGSFFVPQGSEEFPPMGTVVRLGSGIRSDGTDSGMLDDIKIGDRVLFKRQPDSALVPDPREGGDPAWKDLLVLEYSNILAVITEE